MTYSERVAIDVIDSFENFLEDRDVRIPSSDTLMKENDSFTGNSARIYGEDFAELQETIAVPITRATGRIAECVYDLTLMCADLIRDMSSYGDSRSMFATIREWAEEFENQYCDDDDYMTEIEIFGEKKLANLKQRMEVLK